MSAGTTNAEGFGLHPKEVHLRVTGAVGEMCSSLYFHEISRIVGRSGEQ